MEVVTWNVNSIRTRLDRVLAWLEVNEPDVLCLQETKVADDAFPYDAFEDEGWHVEVHGQKTYNGVALIAREAPEDVVRGLPGDGPEAHARLIAGTFDGVRVIDVYVPNGKDVENEAFAFKLEWLARLREMIAASQRPGEELLLLGDFNIAPEDRDVYDPEAFRGKVHFHPKEHEALRALLDWGLEDLFRVHHDEAGLYSWWDYRRLGFQQDRGLRIDLILGTQSMRARCRSCDIDRMERKGEKPSDHAPVTARFR